MQAERLGSEESSRKLLLALQNTPATEELLAASVEPRCQHRDLMFGPCVFRSNSMNEVKGGSELAAQTRKGRVQLQGAQLATKTRCNSPHGTAICRDGAARRSRPHRRWPRPKASGGMGLREMPLRLRARWCAGVKEVCWFVGGSSEEREEVKEAVCLLEGQASRHVCAVVDVGQELENVRQPSNGTAWGERGMSKDGVTRRHGASYTADVKVDGFNWLD